MTTEQYNSLLNRINENLQYMETGTAEEMLEELYAFKPVRLRWFLTKAKVMLKAGNNVEDIVSFLEKQCTPWYLYDDVEEYFNLLSALYLMQGKEREGQRYLYQLNELKAAVDGTDRNLGQNEVLKQMMLETEQNGLKEGNLRKILDLFYITGEDYLWLCWSRLWNQKYTEEKIEERILQRPNAVYYYERLANEKEEWFVLIASEQKDEIIYRATAQVLQMLGKRAIVLKSPITADESMDFGCAVERGLDSIRLSDAVPSAEVYEIEGQDTRKEIMDFIVRNFTQDGLVTILASGFFLDELAERKEMKPQMERLTEAEGDYREERIAVGRYGNYLAYIANIYCSTRQKVEEDLYRKPTCRFSVIIPCRNAGETLRFTLKTCLNQSFQGEYEIVISDNSDAELGEDTPTLQVCREFGDTRIKYYRAPDNLSLMKNFEYAYLKAQGEFLFAMGADDGILPWALEELDSVLTRYQDAPILLWHEAMYYWADTLGKQGTAALESRNGYQKGSPDVFYYPTRDIFYKSLDIYGNMYYLPQLYHNSGIRREYLGTWYEKAGTLWSGISQDISSAVTIANIEKELCFVDNTLTINGLSNASIGVMVLRGNDEIEKRESVRKVKNTIGRGWRVQGYMERLCPPIGGFYGGLYACIMYGYAIGAVPYRVLEDIDWKKVYLKIYGELNKTDSAYEKNLHRLRYAVSRHGEEMLQWFDEECYADAMIFGKCSRQEKVQEEESWNYTEQIVITDERVRAPLHSIEDVFKASLFLQSFWEQGGEAE